jgi:hypothetical protein
MLNSLVHISLYTSVLILSKPSSILVFRLGGCGELGFYSPWLVGG